MNLLVRIKTIIKTNLACELARLFNQVRAYYHFASQVLFSFATSSPSSVVFTKFVRLFSTCVKMLSVKIGSASKHCSAKKSSKICERQNLFDFFRD